MEREECFWLFAFGVLVGAFTLLMMLTAAGKLPRDIERQFQQQAIDHGYAEYDSVTGKWRWKETGEE